MPHKVDRRRVQPRRSNAERDQIVLANFWLPKFVLGKVLGNKSTMLYLWDDLLQAAMLGLLHAAACYDEAGGAFSTYAYWCIKGHILRELQRAPMVTAPKRFSAEVRKEMAPKQVPIGRFESDDWAGPDGRDDLADAERAMDAAALLATIPPREADVLRRRAEGETLVQIGEATGVTRARVQQIEKAALERLREKAGA